MSTSSSSSSLSSGVSLLSSLQTLLDMSVSDYCDFTARNRKLMERLMEYNASLQEMREGMSGDYAISDSSIITTDARSTLSYTESMDYVTNYASSVTSDYTEDIINGTVQDYTNHNQLYYTTKNLYPDDLDSGNGNIPQWITVNQKSLLYKTKQLFHNKKIKTLISRFSTRNNGSIDRESPTDSRSTYGMSHGNGLLKKGAESGYSSESYAINGYNNPYCRVWTHHYQYDKLNKRIRPFIGGDSEDETFMSLEDFHTWKNFGDDSTGSNNVSSSGDSDSSTSTTYGWKNGKAGWDLSVLNKNGFPNIAPKYNGGGSDNTHTKRCMFSIENLAWQGYDPYKFEQALSWEQRGPLGGRIMWFPPYGIRFNENSSVSWSRHTFIGRGEDVYTYTNTTRSGTLQFKMVVDHPSILDYVSWKKGNEDSIKDTDILRFFAGCDVDTLRDAAIPMLLTDEYTENNIYTDATKAEEETALMDDDDENDDDVADETMEVVFYAFFPNNYSGYYDHMGEDVEAVAYLLAGKGTQKDSSDCSDVTSINDISLKFDSVNSSDGNGYEMDEEIGVADNPILGSSVTWSNYNSKIYQCDSDKKWYYRIDGKYEVPGNSEIYINCYDQTLTIEDNYTDKKCHKLNLDGDTVKESLSDTSDNLYSLAEVAAALMTEDNRNSFIDNRGVNSDNVNDLLSIFENYELVSISGVGYATSTGNNASSKINATRNGNLAEQRVKTIEDWFLSYEGDRYNACDDITTDVDHEEKTVTTNDISDLASKKYRSAKITLSFKKSEDKTLAETSQTVTTSDGTEASTSIQEYVGYSSSTDSTGKTYYTKTDDVNGTTYWIEGDNGQLKRVNIVGNTIVEIDETEARATYDVSSGSGEGDRNTVRYDKEYYFFKELEANSPIIYDRLMQKIQYFDPAFHSMTPEGFNARLTFLQQCTRQGNTIGASDTGSETATNLAFGKPPICVLRLGDFYNQMIVVNSINITYDDGLWDLNPEGIGVQPMLADVNINFNFIGGGDLAGPIRRLQNAMTFNYYANARLYDNRADRIEYNWDDKSNGAIDHDVNETKSYYYFPAMYSDKNKDS